MKKVKKIVYEQNGTIKEYRKPRNKSEANSRAEPCNN